MRKVTTEQIKKINVLINQKGMDKEDKKKLILKYTAERETSTKEMSVGEATELIRHLTGGDPRKEKADVMRKKFISMAHECGWRIPGTDKIDMSRVNGWCMKYSYLKKKLNDYTYEELPKLLSQFEEVYKDLINKL